jgi:hypothetical protein
MLLITTLPSAEVRAAVRETVPWSGDLRALAGGLGGALRHQSVDMIDFALPGSHIRSALVACQEGVDCLLQATLDLAESVATESYADEHVVTDPWGDGSPLGRPEKPAQMCLRLTRCAIENAAVRSVAGADHLANAHLRVAWEANAAHATEVGACGFDPLDEDPHFWASAEDLRKGLESLSGAAAVLPSFIPTRCFLAYATDGATGATRKYRNCIAHRERPGHRDAPALGRASKWRDGRMSVTVRSGGPVPDANLPTLDQRRAEVARSVQLAAAWAEALWTTTVSWLPLLGVHIRHDREAGRVQMRIDGGDASLRAPRESRDPGPVLEDAA